MLPQVLQPAEYRTPVAELNIDGLGLCCFNSSLREWEVAFLRDSGHNLEIKVREVDREGKIIQELTNPPIPSGDTGSIIRLSVDNSSGTHLNDFEKGFFKTLPRFSRAGDDSYDFRWTIDFVGRNMPHGNFNGLITKAEKPERVNVTIVTIPNALLYTKRVTRDSVILAPDNGQGPGGSPVFGRTNEVVGGAVYATTQGAIRLEYVGGSSSIPTVTLSQPATAGNLYEISLTNMDVSKLETSQARVVIGSYVEGDFKHYYDVIKVTGQKHTLHAPHRGLARAIDGDCHIEGVGHDGGSISTLMPLL
jgi:hypothetical protein